MRSSLPAVAPAAIPRILCAGLFVAASLGCGGLLSSQPGPAIHVRTVYSGAGPEEVDQAVALPLSTELRSVPNVTSITSLSKEGALDITVQFGAPTDPFDALSLVGQAIRTETLPVDVQTPWVFEETATGLTVAVGGAHDRAQLSEVAERLRLELITLPGVDRVALRGAPGPELLIEVDPTRLEAHAVSVGEVAAALEATSLPGGTGDGGFGVQGLGSPADPEELAAILVRPGLRIGDLADLRLQLPVAEQVWVRTGPGALLVVSTRSSYAPGSVEARLADITVSLPPHLDIEVLPTPTAELRAQCFDRGLGERLALVAEEAGATAVWFVQAPTDPLSGPGELTLWARGGPEVTVALRAALGETPGVDGLVRGEDSETLTVWVTAPDFETARRSAEELRDTAAHQQGVLGTALWPTGVTPRVEVHLDLEALARLGLTSATVHEALRVAGSGVEVGAMHEGERSVPVLLRAPPREDAVEALTDLRISGVPLSAMATVELVTESPLARRDLRPAVRLECEVQPDRLAAVRAALTEGALGEGVVLELAKGGTGRPAPDGTR